MSARQAVDGDVEFLTVKEVAERISMSRWFVYSHGRELGLVKFGGSNRYRLDRVDEYVAQRLACTVEEPPTAASPPPSAPLPRRESRPSKRRRVPLLEVGANPPPRRGPP